MEEIHQNYVDGFVVAIPTVNREIYREHAAKAAIVFKEYGALNVVECWGDVDPRMQPEGNSMPFDGKRLIYGGFEVMVEA